MPLREGTHFIIARRIIRDALREDSVSEQIDGLVSELLDVDANTPVPSR